MAVSNSRFRVMRILLMTLAIPTSLMSWGHSKVLAWQNPFLQTKKMVSSSNRENSFSPESQHQQGLYFRSVNKAANLLLEPSFAISPKNSTPKALPKLPELRKSAIDDLPELLSEGTDFLKVTDTNTLNLNETTSILMHDFVATAYCLKGFTACGVKTGVGVVAADPKVLPLGSIVRIEAGNYSGLYKVLDTGPGVRGKRLDIYVPYRNEARNFGRQNIRVEVVRYGWGNSNKSEDLTEGQ